MKEFINNIESLLENNLHFIVLENENQIKQSELAIQEVLNAINKIKRYVLKYKFRSEGEEIDFFKHIKPQFLSKLIYFNEVYNIETKRPNGGEKIVRKYLSAELEKLKRFFNNNFDFYRYYRTQSTYLDNKYFVRRKLDIKLNVDTYVFESDTRFTTSHDFKVAKIIANDLLEVYLKEELTKLDRIEPNEFKIYTPKVKLTWTDNKTALIELIYALYYQGSFNNGNADIKEITRYFETVFNADLGDVYRTFLELKNRKTGKTKFLNSITDLLNKKIDENDI